MSKRRNWLRTTIAMLTLVATVLETGFTTVSTLAAETTTEDGIVVNTDAIEESEKTADDGDIQIDVVKDEGEQPADEGEQPADEGEQPADEGEQPADEGEQPADEGEQPADEGEQPADEGEQPADEGEQPVIDGEEIGEEQPAAEEEVYEEAEDLKVGTLEISDSSISGSGYDEISIYVNTDELANKDRFRLEFTGPDSASYNPIINDDLDKTNGGRYDFENLEGGDFTVRATSTENVILSYKYNEDGYPSIVLKSEPVDKVLEADTLTSIDDAEIQAVRGEGYDSVNVKFNTEELSDTAAFKLVVESDADATVDGRDAKAGITGLDKNTDSLTIEGLDQESFVAYVLSDKDDLEIKTVVNVESVEDGVVEFTVDNVYTKRVYEYEDDKIKVTATLEKADAVPDDAYFGVEPLSEEEAEKYLEALNKDKDPENGDVLATAENTLLYDIGFYTDESKSEEIEPEEGSVRLNVEFKQNQMSDELGAENKEDIEVTHFVEEDGNIEPEKLDVSQNGDVDSVEVETDTFSKFAFKTNNGNGELEMVGQKGSETSKGLLGEAWLYGITANKWIFDGEAETSFAVNTIKANGGHTGVNSTKAEGSNYQYSVVGSVDGSTQIKGYDCELTIPQTESSKITGIGGAKIDYVFTDATSIKTKVDGMISAVQTISNTLATKDNGKQTGANSYEKLPANPSGDHITFDLDKPGIEDGTYYINLDKYSGLKNAFARNGQVHIKKRAGQKIVFNTTATSAQFSQFTIIQNNLKQLEGYTNEGYPSTKMADMSTGKNPVVEDIIFNMPNATEVDLSQVAGIFLAPKANVNVHDGASGGWIVAKEIKTSCEWHFVNGKIPNPPAGKIVIPVNKKFIGGSGKWLNGFTFELQKMSGDGKSVDTSFTARTITLNGGDSEDAGGSFTLTYDPVNLSYGPNYTGWYPDYSEVHEEWYRISELIPNPSRNDVEYNIIDPVSDAYGANGPNWFVHAYVFRLNIGPWYQPNYKYCYRFRTARKDPNGYDWSKGAPCVESQPVSFINKYVPPTEVPVTLNGEKIVTVTDSDPVIKLSVPDKAFTFSAYGYTTNGVFNSEPISGFTVKNMNQEDGRSTITFPEMTLNFDQGPTGWNNGGTRWSHENSTQAYFYFLIKETDGPKNTDGSYVYDMDEHVYIAKVTMTKTDGDPTASVEYFKYADMDAIATALNTGTGDNPIDKIISKGENVGGVQFTYNNTRDASCSTKIFGQKILINRDDKPIKEKDFSFVLTKKGVDPKEHPEGIIATSYTSDKVDGQGNIAYFEFAPKTGDDDEAKNHTDELRYTLKDLHGKQTETVEYTIWEVGANNDEAHSIDGKEKEGITWVDKYKEDVTVTLTMDANGNISASNPYEATRVSFTNSGKADGNIKVYVSKVEEAGLNDMQKAGLNKESFTFTLYKLNKDDLDNPIEKGTVTRKVGETAEAFEFIPTYSLKDDGKTFYYAVKETVDTNKPYIKFEERWYYIKVVVSKNGSSKLTRTITTGFADSFDAFDAGTDPAKYDHFNEVYVDDENQPIVINAVFANGYNVFDGKDHIEGTKVLYRYDLLQKAQKQEVLTENEFQFKMEPVDIAADDISKDAKSTTAKVIMPATADDSFAITVGNKQNGDIIFPDITFRQVGDYTFKVSEVEPKEEDKTDNEKNIKYTGTTHNVTFSVTGPDANGKLTVTHSPKKDIVKFINYRFDPTKTVLEAHKKINGASEIPAGKTFKFAVVEVNADATMDSVASSINVKESDVEKNTGFVDVKPATNGKTDVTFKQIDYYKKELGTATSKDYKYVIFEVIPDNAVKAADGINWEVTDVDEDGKKVDPYIYDGHMVFATVTVSVDNTDNKLKVSDPVYTPAAAEFDGAPTFNNKYEASGSFDADGVKKIHGRKFVDGDAFVIKMEAVSGPAYIPTENYQSEVTVESKEGEEEQNFSFAPISFNLSNCPTETDPAVYKIYEKDGGGAIVEGVGGVKNSAATYYVKVYLTKDNKDGTLEFAREYYSDAACTKPAGSVEFVNTVNPKGSAILEAKKSFEHGTLKGEDFKFFVKDGEGDDAKTVREATNTSGGDITFNPIVYTLDNKGELLADNAAASAMNGYNKISDKKWEMTYYVSEEDKDINNVEIVNLIYKAVVTIEDKGEKDVETGDVILSTSTKYYVKGEDGNYSLVDNKYGNTPEFVNKYSLTGDVTLYATKELLNRTQREGQFGFILKDESGKQIGDVSYTDADGKAWFIGKDKDDNVVLSDLCFDETDIETAKDTDTDKSHAITDGKNNVIKYVKYYTLKEYTPLDWPEKDRPKSEDLEYKPIEIKDKDGNVTDTLEGLYYKGYTYDLTTYEVIVTLDVTKPLLGGERKIQTDWEVHKKGEEEQPEYTWWDGLWDKVKELFGGTADRHKALFVNEYEQIGALQLSAEKILNYKTQKAGDFTFVLDGKDEDDKEFKNYPNNAFTVATSKVGDKYIATFPEIIYKKVGTYTYTLKEVVPTGEGVTTDDKGRTVKNGIHYSNTVYTVNVTVSESGGDGDGRLIVTADIVDQSNKSAGATFTPDKLTINKGTADERVIDLYKSSPVDFTNEYVVEGDEVPVEGVKTIPNRKVKAGDFLFVLQNANANTPAYAEVAANDADGNFSFPNIVYDPSVMAVYNGDTFTGYDERPEGRNFEYVITEVTPENYNKFGDQINKMIENKGFTPIEGVNYTTETQKITVNVKCANGKLEATRTDKVGKASFINSYGADGDISFNVEKEVDKTEAKNVTFKFTLKDTTGSKIKVPVYDENGNKTGVTTVDYLSAEAVNGAKSPFDHAIAYELSDLGTQNADGSYSKTFTYKVEEVDESATNKQYKYTDDYYLVEVTATNNGSSSKVDTSFKATRYKKDASGAFQKDPEFTDKSDVLTFKFTNGYTAENFVEIPGNKNFVGAEDNQEMFRFRLYERGAEGKYTDLVTLKDYTVVEEKADGSKETTTVHQENPVELHSGEFKFHIDYSTENDGDVGTHYYKVDEYIPDNEAETGYVYDHTVYYVRVIVTEEDGSGTLKVDRKIVKTDGTAVEFDENGKPVESCDFTNTEVQPNSIRFKALKELDGKELKDMKLNGKKYRFEFKMTDTSGKTVVGKDADGNDVDLIAYNNDGGEILFDAITYDPKTDIGEHKYQLVETVDSEEFKKMGIAPITVKHDAVVNVEKDGTGLKITVTVDGKDVTPTDGSGIVDGVKFKSILFENQYRSSIPVRFAVTKNLEGFEAAPDEAYVFALKDEKGKVLQIKDNKVVSADGKEQKVEIKPTNATGPFTEKFDKIVYDQSDYKNSPFKYVIEELIPEKKGDHVVYDKKLYNVKVTLNYDENGQLEATVDSTVKTDKSDTSCVAKPFSPKETTDDGVPVYTFDFTNKYLFNQEDFDGIKTIKGRKLGTYTFTLTDITDPSDKKLIEEVQNDGSAIDFKPIGYDANDVGLHVYEIRETVSVDGSTCSDFYIATVDVSIGTDGKSIVLEKHTYKNEIKPENKSEIVFENDYDMPGQVPIPVIKTMYTKCLDKDEFSFTLKDSTGKKIQTIQNPAAELKKQADGKYRAVSEMFWFDPIKLNSKEVLKVGENTYADEVKLYYTVEEEPDARTYIKDDNTVYVVEITVTAEKDKLNARITGIQGSDSVDKENGGVITYLKSLIGKFTTPEEEKEFVCEFGNRYHSEAIIDPPILTKAVLGREVHRGEFSFRITGPGLPSKGEKEYVRTIVNGYVGDPALKETEYYNPITKKTEILKEDELFIGDIKYQFNEIFDDLHIEDHVSSKYANDFGYETIDGKQYSKYVYHAEEIKDPSNTAIDWSPAQYSLTVYVRDNEQGSMIVKGLAKHDGKLVIVEGIENLEWIQETPNKIDPQGVVQFEGKKVDIVNIENQEGSLDLIGKKIMKGRDLIADKDKFVFRLSELDQDGNPIEGRVVTRENTKNSQGEPSDILFYAKKKGNIEGIDFLNYRFGAFETTPGSDEYKAVDDTGIHTYLIEEIASEGDGIKYDTVKFKVYVDVQSAKAQNGELLKNKEGKPYLVARITGVDQIFSENNKKAFDYAIVSNAYGDVGYFAFEFTNEFEAKGKIDFEGIKYLKDQEGNALVSPDSMKDQFEFAIHQYKNPERIGGKDLIYSTRTDEKGYFKLVIPEYTQELLKNNEGKYDTEKTLYYRITEVKPTFGVWSDKNTVFESDGIIYDSTEYDVDVTVKYVGTKDLDISYVIKKAATGETVEKIEYTNIVKEYTTVEGNKFWNDGVNDPKTRPDVIVNLYSRTASDVVTKINTYTIKAPDTTYRFATDDKGNKLPAYDSAGRPIKYEVEEVPIEGYLCEQDGYDFYNSQGHILIRKIDADTRIPLAGAELAIYDGTTQIEKWTSGASAHVIKAELKPGKTYTLKELKAPEGYELAADMTFTVPEDGSSITVTMSDKPIVGSVRLTKRDASTRETLAGAEFALFTKEGTRIYATGSAGSYKVTTTTSNGVFVTNSSGTLTVSDLPYGSYYFMETKAPSGYALSSERLGFTVLKSGELVEVTYLNTKALGSVRLRKVSSSGSRALSGAVFELYAKTPKTVGQAAASTIFKDAYYRYGTYRTNSSGEIYVDKLPWDDYYFIEVEAPKGYKLAVDVNGDPLVYTFTISEANSSATIDLGSIVNYPEEEETPPPTPPVTPVPPTPETPETPSGVLGERVKKGGVVNGVLGVRSKPTSGVLGERVGPVTGDASNIVLWLLLLGACVATIVATIMTGKKKKTGAK